MSQNEVSVFGSKMSTLRGKTDTSFWDIGLLWLRSPWCSLFSRVNPVGFCRTLAFHWGCESGCIRASSPELWLRSSVVWHCASEGIPHEAIARGEKTTWSFCIVQQSMVVKEERSPNYSPPYSMFTASGAKPITSPRCRLTVMSRAWKLRQKSPKKRTHPPMPPLLIGTGSWCNMPGWDFHCPCRGSCKTTCMQKLQLYVASSYEHSFCLWGSWCHGSHQTWQCDSQTSGDWGAGWH